jgi:D-tyrosyl-tRNA(Tyr) deacylase
MPSLILNLSLMKVVLQKVSQASVAVDGAVIGSIGEGYMLLTGIMEGDGEDCVRWMAQKVVGLRLFPGADGKINDRSILEIGGEALVISQFTLAGVVEKGNRPDYTAAAKPEEAERLYLLFIEELKKAGIANVQHGKFRSTMSVSLVNEGPVTLVIER